MNNSYTELIRLIDEFNKNNSDKINLSFGEQMSRHTSFRIGGAADIFAAPTSRKALLELCGMIKNSGIKYYFLGNGSNVLFDDGGFRGIVVSLENLKKIESAENTVTADAGANLINVCKKSRDDSLAGLEFSYGIPGSVGGAVFMNAGAYGGEISSVLKSSTYLDLEDLTEHTLENKAHEFGYRDSIYRHNPYLILSAEFELTYGDKDRINDMMNEYMERRITKQPLDLPSAGSVFKRPEGYFSGKLIEDSGLKGYTVGGAQVSEKHAGFIVNIGGATSHDVLSLIEHINNVIEKNYGFRLECEMIHVK